MLLWFWLATHLEGIALFGASTLIMLSPNVLELSRWATPDALAMFVAAAGLYLILAHDKYFWGSALLVLDVWIRTDSIVLAGIVMFVLLFSAGKPRIPPVRFPLRPGARQLLHHRPLLGRLRLDRPLLQLFPGRRYRPRRDGSPCLAENVSRSKL